MRVKSYRNNLKIKKSQEVLDELRQGAELIDNNNGNLINNSKVALERTIKMARRGAAAGKEKLKVEEYLRV